MLGFFAALNDAMGRGMGAYVRPFVDHSGQ